MRTSHRFRRQALRLGLVAVLLAAILLPSAVTADASQIEELERRIQQYQRELNRIQQEERARERELERVQSEQRGVRAQIVELDKSLDETNRKLEETRLQLADAEQRLAAAQEELAAAEAELARREDLLGRRLRAIAEHGTLAYLDILLSAETFSDFLKRFELLQQIIEQDVTLLEAVQHQRDMVEEYTLQVQRERAQIVELETQLAAQQRELEVQIAQRRNVLASLQQSEAEIRAALEAQERASREIERLLQQLQQELATLLAGEDGTFRWPVDRSGYFRISSQFGNRWHPILNEYRLHAGVDLAKTHGSNVYAVAPGRVITSGWLSGYGNTVVIAHTPTLSTLYAHNSENLVKAGDTVKAGQVIARVGMTGTATGPHLHFEVRENGKPVDPMPYLP